MIKEEITRFNCEDHECERKFDSMKELLSHYSRRHPFLFDRYTKTEETQKFSSKTIFDDLCSQIDKFESDFNPEDINYEPKFKDTPENSLANSRPESASLSQSMNMTTNSFNEINKRVREITPELLKIGSEFQDIADIDEVIILLNSDKS